MQFSGQNVEKLLFCFVFDGLDLSFINIISFISKKVLVMAI